MDTSVKAGALRATAIALALLALQQPARAADYIWQGGDGVWDDASRWTLLGVPGSGDSATVRATGTGQVLVRDPRSVGTLFIDGNLASTSVLSVGTLQFGSGAFGTAIAKAGGVMNVSGNASFDGAQSQLIDYTHVVNLGANASWAQGNGRLIVGTAYSSGNERFETSQLNIGAGTTFSDAGAASASGFKVIGGGAVNNDGTYLRSGLGTTYARGFNNRGTLDVAGGDFIFDAGNWLNTSNGLVKVASGSTLGLANVSFTGGSIVNAGLVRQIGGSNSIGSAVQIGGAWQLDSGVMSIEGTHTLASLVVNGQRLDGTATLNVGTLAFNYGTIGGANQSRGGVMNVAGTAVLDGTSSLDLGYSQTINLAGNTQWTAGNGRLALAGAFSDGPSFVPAAQLKVGIGTTFTDAGAASAGGTKTLAGAGQFYNFGSYVRTGLGTTELNGFINGGNVYIVSGALAVDARFANHGQVDIASGASLGTQQREFGFDGLLTGNGTVKTFAPGQAVTLSGSIDPGQGTALGALTVDGDLTMTDSSLLRIVLGNGGASDLLSVTGGVLWNGVLDVWSLPGTVLQAGEVFTIAGYGQRLAGSSFDSISWHGGLSADQFSIEYTADSVLLRVTAVPEPASYALLALGLLMVAGRKWRRGPGATGAAAAGKN